METLYLHSVGLLSKWGFNDGDMPDEVMDELEARLGWFDERCDWHATLKELVRAHLLPKIEQRVDVVTIGTSHNPIRAEYVDGVEVDWRESADTMKLTPEYVAVPMDEVVRVALSHMVPRPVG